MRDHGYPAARERAAGPAGAVAERLYPPRTTGGFVTLTDAEAEIIHFGRAVARVKILALDNDATIRLTRRGNPTGDVIVIPAGAEWDENAACETVRAANATAGATARVQIEGYYL